MFTKLLRGAVWATATLLSASVHAEETIDAFARAHLKASQEAQDAKQAQAKAQAAGDGKTPTFAKPALADVPPELLFIYGVENASVAYLRVDGKFGRNVAKGDKVGLWQVVQIGDDFVDIRRGARQQRLLLPNAFGEAPSSSEQTSRRVPGQAHGDDY
ncbi:hypothetical protein PAN31117_03523 [Pandoraea anapnoica]|uniref:Type IV pilus biogenesis protein PilP n=1 Tax=Pandoraea anapnoica TaxID=2508301 RepID=A0A5E5A9Z3_9BURK|nr:hypothetical protein [Pandoraea anapnoica]VVE69946.1 hypothetical protein PAN31117_03523 [Pandoraea anapnoica]